MTPAVARSLERVKQRVGAVARLIAGLPVGEYLLHVSSASDAAVATVLAPPPPSRGGDTGMHSPIAAAGHGIAQLHARASGGGDAPEDVEEVDLGSGAGAVVPPQGAPLEFVPWDEAPPGRIPGTLPPRGDDMTYCREYARERVCSLVGCPLAHLSATRCEDGGGGGHGVRNLGPWAFAVGDAAGGGARPVVPPPHCHAFVKGDACPGGDGGSGGRGTGAGGGGGAGGDGAPAAAVDTPAGGGPADLGGDAQGAGGGGGVVGAACRWPHLSIEDVLQALALQWRADSLRFVLPRVGGGSAGGGGGGARGGRGRSGGPGGRGGWRGARGGGGRGGGRGGPRRGSVRGGVGASGQQ